MNGTIAKKNMYSNSCWLAS